MSSNYIDSILPKYQAESAAANLVNYNTQARSMYPYVSVTSHQLSSTPATNMSPFTAMTANTDGDKQCRYSQTGATDMSQYGLNLQNCATTSNMAQYFHQNNVTNPLNSCSQPTPTPHIPDIPRYPWMSITGKTSGCFFSVIFIPVVFLLCLVAPSPSVCVPCFTVTQNPCVSLSPEPCLPQEGAFFSLQQGSCDRAKVSL